MNAYRLRKIKAMQKAWILYGREDVVFVEGPARSREEVRLQDSDGSSHTITLAMYVGPKTIGRLAGGLWTWRNVHYPAGASLLPGLNPWAKGPKADW